MNNTELYNNIMKNIGKQIEKALNENFISEVLNENFITEDDMQEAANFLVDYLEDTKFDILDKFIKIKFEDDPEKNISDKALEKIIETTILHIKKDNNLL